MSGAPRCPYISGGIRCAQDGGHAGDHRATRDPDCPPFVAEVVITHDDGQRDAALALLREAADTVRALVLAGKAPSSTDFIGLGDLDGRIRAFLAEGPAGPAPGTVQATGAPVHLLVGGVAACGAGVPLSWPEGGRWTDRALVATCAACRQWARATDWHRERG